MDKNELTMADHQGNVFQRARLSDSSEACFIKTLREAENVIFAITTWNQTSVKFRSTFVIH